MKNKFLVNLSLFISTFLLLALTAEALLILRWDILGGGLKRSRYPHWIAPDPELMWIPKANVSFNYMDTDNHGVSYPVHYQTGPHGFRQWGNLQSPNKKLLVIGDSITHALEVSNDKTYYAPLGQTLSVEVFALGVSAYNTIQEWLALKRFISIIHPDMILWQFNQNDLTSNDCRHRARFGFLHNPNKKLLCWDVEKNQLVYYPQNRALLWLVELKMTTPSRLLYWISSRTLSIFIKDTHPETFPLDRLEHGKESTKILFRKIKEVVKDKPFYILSDDESDFFTQTLKEIAAENQFHFIQGAIPDQIEKLGKERFMPDQFHWSEKGHAVIAAFLIQYFQSKVGLPSGERHESLLASYHSDVMGNGKSGSAG